MTDEEMAEESLISYRKEPKWTGKMFMQDENTCYKDGFLTGLKAGRDTAETDLATVAYMQGADNQKKKSDKQLAKAESLIVRLSTCFSSYADNIFENELLKEAEQFLNEVEK